MTEKSIALDKIRIDGGTQPRAEINHLVVDDYAEAMRGGKEFPPVTLFFDGTDNWLADGFHRYHARRRAGLPDIAAKIEKGTQRDAILFSVGANAAHGLRRTNADKRRAVGVLLADKEWVKRSDRWIAEKCAVNHETVGRAREQLALNASSRLGHDGKERKLPAQAQRPTLSDEDRTRLQAIARGEVETEPEPAFAPEAVRAVLRSLPTAENPSEVKAIAKLAPEKQAAVVEHLADGSAGTVKEALGLAKIEAKAELAATIRAEPTPPPKGPFRVIAIDPPWKYDNRVEDTSHRGRNQYPDMTQAQIAALPVPTLAAKDCILWLWTTNAFMDDALALVEEWGFTQKTILTWDKRLLGLGDWLRNVTEHCLLAVRGKPIVTLTNQTTLISEARREHSRKPEAFYALVESLCPVPEGGRLEMFSREQRKGWIAWGAEVGKFAEG